MGCPMKRRDFITGIAAGALLGLPAPLAAATRSQIGEYELISVSDGHLVLPGSMMFAGLPRQALDPILAAHNVDFNQLMPPCNLALLKGPGVLALFDAGSGSGFMPSAGRALDGLAALGIAADEITHVVLTHAHPDHLWGVLDDFDDMVFANAAHLVPAAEWAFWRDPNTVDRIGPARASFAVGAARRLGVIAEQVETVSDNQEILPGVLAHATPGHTPGHMSFEIRRGGSGILIGGDAIGNAHVAFARPEWPSGTDQDADLAARTRRKLLDMLAQDDTQLLGFHLPDGGLGRVERAPGGYRFAQG